jgi:hypothetical protein
VDHADALDHLDALPDASVHCCLTSPPFWRLQDYGVPPSRWPDGWEGCLGLEPTPDQYVAHLVEIFRLVRRVLRPDGVLWLQLGDSLVTDPGNGRGGEGNYGLGGGAPHRSAADKTGCGLPAKNLAGVPWRVALAMQAEGWVLRSECIWEMSNALPEGARDRPARSHPHVFLLTRPLPHPAGQRRGRKPPREPAEYRRPPAQRQPFRA